MPNEALARLWVSMASIINPGTMNEPYDTPSTDSMREPIAEPNTTKYNTVVRTGEAKLHAAFRFRKSPVSREYSSLFLYQIDKDFFQ